MKRKHLVYLLMSGFAAANGFAETLADPDEIQPVKTFSPPNPIAPTAAQGYFPENRLHQPPHKAISPKTNSTAPTVAIITLLPKT